MRGFVEHVERCEKCMDLEERGVPESEKDQAQFEHFRDSFAELVDRVHDEWKDRQNDSK